MIDVKKTMDEKTLKIHMSSNSAQGALRTLLRSFGCWTQSRQFGLMRGIKLGFFLALEWEVRVIYP